MSDKTGGQAFPCPGMVTPNGDLYHPEPGMTMRQYYAAKAMQGHWAAQTESPGYFSTCSNEVLMNHAVLYLRMADAMIAVENKQATLGVSA